MKAKIVKRCHSITSLFLGRCINKIKLVIILSTLCFVTACATTMTLQEAKNISMEMSAKTFVPPPRGIKDTIALLENVSQQELDEIKAAQNILNTPASENMSDADHLQILEKQARAATRLGQFYQAIDFANKIRQISEKPDPSLVVRLASSEISIQLDAGLGYAEKYLGNHQKAIELFERYLIKRANSSIYKELVESYLAVGNLKMARKRLEEGQSMCLQYPRAAIHRGNYASMQASFLEAEGKLTESETFRKQAIV